MKLLEIVKFLFSIVQANFKKIFTLFAEVW